MTAHHNKKSKRIMSALLFNIWLLTSCKGLSPSIPLPVDKANHPWMQASDHKPLHLSLEEDEETAVLKQEDDQLKSTQLQGDTNSSLTYRFLDDFTFIEGIKGLEAHVHDGVTKASLLVDRDIASRLPQLGMSGAGLEKVKGLLNQGYYPYKKSNQVHFDRGLLGGAPSKGKQDYIPRDWTKEPNIQTFKGHTRVVYTLIELSDGSLASAGDKTIKLWDRAGNCIQRFEGHKDKVCTLIERSDGTLASGSYDNTIKIWDRAGNCIQIFEGRTNTVYTLIELKDGTLASCSSDNTIKIWDRAGNCIQTFEGHTNTVYTLIELKDGTLASGSKDKTIKLWDRAGKCIKTFYGHTDSVFTLIELKDGTLASGSKDKTIKLWDRDGNCIQTIKGHISYVLTLIELKDGILASGSYDNTIKLWDRDGKCIQILNGHTNTVKKLIELSDGTLASGAGDGTIKIWDRDGNRIGITSPTSAKKAIKQKGSKSIQKSINKLSKGKQTYIPRNWQGEPTTQSFKFKGHNREARNLIERLDGTLASGDSDGTIEPAVIASSKPGKQEQEYPSDYEEIVASVQERLKDQGEQIQEVKQEMKTFREETQEQWQQMKGWFEIQIQDVTKLIWKSLQTQEAQITSLNQSMQSHETKIADYKQIIDNHVSGTPPHKEQVLAHEKQIQDQQQKIKEYTQQLLNQTQESNRQAKLIQDYKINIQSHQAAIDLHKKEKAACEDQAKIHENNIHACKQAIKEHEKKIVALSKEMQASSEQSQEQKNKIEAFKNQIKDQAALMQAHQQALEVCKQEIKNHGQQIQSHDAKLKAHEKQLKEHAAKIEALKQEVKVQQEQIEIHEKQIQYQEKEISEHRKQLDNILQEIQTCRNQLKEQEDKIQVYEKEIKVCVDQIASLKHSMQVSQQTSKEQIEYNRSVIKKFQDQVQKNKFEITKHKNQRAHLNSKIRSFEHKLQAHEIEIQAHEAEIEIHNQQIQENEEQIQAHKKELAAYEVQIQAHGQQLQAHEVQINMLHDILEIAGVKKDEAIKSKLKDYQINHPALFTYCSTFINTLQCYLDAYAVSSTKLLKVAPKSSKLEDAGKFLVGKLLGSVHEVLGDAFTGAYDAGKEDKHMNQVEVINKILGVGHLVKSEIENSIAQAALKIIENKEKRASIETAVVKKKWLSERIKSAKDKLLGNYHLERNAQAEQAVEDVIVLLARMYKNYDVDTQSSFEDQIVELVCKGSLEDMLGAATSVSMREINKVKPAFDATLIKKLKQKAGKGKTCKIYFEKKYIRACLEKAGVNVSNAHMIASKIVLFKAMCEGINVHNEKSLDEAETFAKDYPELIKRIVQNFPDYFVHLDIAARCIQGDAVLWEQLQDKWPVQPMI